MQVEEKTIAKEYRSLSMQEKVDMLAKTFGAKEGKVVSRPMFNNHPFPPSGDSLSRIYLQFDHSENKMKYLGSERTAIADTEKIQAPLVNQFFEKFNPENVERAKALALPALKELEELDNLMANAKRLNTYRLLSIELVNTASEKDHVHIGDYYAILDIGGKLYAHYDPDFNNEILRGTWDSNGVDYTRPVRTLSLIHI